MTVTVTNPGAEREPGQWIYLHCAADGEQCIAE